MDWGARERCREIGGGAGANGADSCSMEDLLNFCSTAMQSHHTDLVFVTWGKTLYF